MYSCTYCLEACFSPPDRVLYLFLDPHYIGTAVKKKKKKLVIYELDWFAAAGLGSVVGLKAYLKPGFQSLFSHSYIYLSKALRPL